MRNDEGDRKIIWRNNGQDFKNLMKTDLRSMNSMQETYEKNDTKAYDSTSSKRKKKKQPEKKEMWSEQQR